MTDHELTETEIWTDVFEKVVELVNVGMPVSTGMASIIDACEIYFPHNDWEKFRHLEYDDISGLSTWITFILKHDPVPAETRGLWFGIFNASHGGRQVTADFYVSGSRVFSAADAYCEWARDAFYLPSGRLAHSDILDAIYRIAYESTEGLRDTAEYSLCLAYGGLAVKQLLLQLDHGLILGNALELGVAVGFDEGDCIVLGVIDHMGFAPAGEPGFE
ncbi:MAG TPA: hypothetical protein PKJ77_06500 [Thermodesulfobacteriota bacterium]|nr:hypothetical protein [Thermodesulfobacteriota bacterium]